MLDITVGRQRLMDIYVRFDSDSHSRWEHVRFEDDLDGGVQVDELRECIKHHFIKTKKGIPAGISKKVSFLMCAKLRHV